MVVDKYEISRHNLTQVYILTHLYNDEFEEELSFCLFDEFKKPTLGMKFRTMNERLILKHMEHSSPGTHLHQ